MFDFQGKIIVVTGGETGIGRSTVEAFVRANATVVIAGYLEDEGQSGLCCTNRLRGFIL